MGTAGTRGLEGPAPVTRRQFVCGLGAAGLAMPLASTLAACGSASGSSTTTAAIKPRLGGVAKVAVGSVSTSENLDPTHLWDANESTYVPNIYDQLLINDDSWASYPVLAESWQPNSEATQWTFKLRTGVRFHDGEQFTSADAAYTIRHILDPKVGAPGYASLAAILDPEGVKTPDSRTLVLSLKSPAAAVPVILGQAMIGLMREGTTDFSKTANGTGPFKLVSFTPGQSWELERNPNYWAKGLPYLDGMRGVAATDSTTKLEGIIAGDNDLGDPIDYSLVKLVSPSNGVTLLVEKAAIEAYIILDTRVPPFNDNRVRTAFKLAMNRPLITQTAFAGHSELTSDTPAASTDPFYPPTLGIRVQNIAQAKSLLTEAGHPNGLDVELHTSDLIGGVLDMTVAFAKTVQPAGIRVTLKQSPAATYFTAVWKQVPMFVSYVSHAPPEVRLPETFTSDGAWQETHYKNTPVDGWVKHGYAALDPARRKAIWAQALTWISYNEGYLDAGFADGLSPVRTNLKGVRIYPQIASLRSAYFSG
jgi:peptide/nickel transport system substrate-binding protein